ncbi:MAG: TonB-dependent receptor [Bacteroidales bacterium]|nr:TonB-dependent receptor [Bacteroidales bacterium]
MRNLYVLVMLLTSSIIDAQTRQICGYVADKNTLEPLIGASVVISGAGGVATDKNGFFCLDIPANISMVLSSSYVGYKTQHFTLKPTFETTIQLYLEPGLSIGDVVVTAQANKRADVINIPIQRLSAIPNITGEPDLLKALHTMPGIQMGKEGTSDLYVRGGEKDENLYLLDDVPLYYVNHIGGFMSVFDTNIIKDVTVYKGVIPARYGGRLSSAIDVRLKDGNAGEHKGEFMMGTLASKFYLEGPYKNNQKTKYLVSLRRCNLDLFMRPYTRLITNGEDANGYTFFDGTIKLTHTFTPKDKITALVYFGRDKLFFNTIPSDEESKYKQKINWGNRVFSLKWNHLFNNHVFNETRFTINRFFNTNKNSIESDDLKDKSVLRSSINDYTLQNQFKIINRNTKIYAGGGINMHHFKPTVSETTTTTTATGNYNYSYKVHTWAPELYVFTDLEWDLSSKLSVNPGLRLVYWSNASQWSIDPRLALNYSLRHNLYINGGYSYNHQYIHLLTGSSSGFPAELWIPASKELAPKTAELASLGLFYTPRHYTISAEAFIKQWDNLVVFNPSLFVLGAANWDKMVDAGGTGLMRGIEFFASKNTGNVTGSLAYTLSRNRHRFEQINNGKSFPFKYDRRHELTTSLNIKLSANKSLSFTWVYNTGTPATVPHQWYPAINNFNNTISFNEAHFYGSINNYRAPAYHRLDIGYSRTKKVRNRERVLFLGVYNAYNNMNPFYVYLQQNEGQVKLYKFTLFPMIPSISYSVKF